MAHRSLWKLAGVAVTPSRSSHATHPGTHPDGLLRTVQRRMKIRRAEIARELVFGANLGAPGVMVPDARRDMKASRVGDHQDHFRFPASPNEIGQEHSAEAMD